MVIAHTIVLILKLASRAHVPKVIMYQNITSTIVWILMNVLSWEHAVRFALIQMVPLPANATMDTYWINQMVLAERKVNICCLSEYYVVLDEFCIKKLCL